ncbi:MAG: hypothetical protein DMG53_04270 [Acidobacteria bacterium]|nr:MAG: hypothetical protein DMG53_04270 [Acidobacteriota bacterium]
MIFNTLWAHPLPDVASIRSYGTHLVHNAQEASTAGRPDEAESLLNRVDEFGRHMADQGETDFERMVGLSVSHQALAELRTLQQTHGMDRQSQEAAPRLEDVDERIESLGHSFRPCSPAERALDHRALLVQLSAVLAMLVAIVAAFSLFALELPLARPGQQRIRLRRTICVAADWAPAALLIGCFALLLLFQPYAQILRSARSLGSASEAWHSMHFAGLFTLSASLGALAEPFTAVHFWQAFIAASVGLALFVLARGFLGHKRA